MSTAEGSLHPHVAARSRRRTRLWMALMMLTPLVLTAVVLISFETSGPSEPAVAARSVPTGFQAITNAYFGYAIPAGWTQQAEWTDQAGDYFYGHPSAFVAETLLVPHLPPTASSRPPNSFGSFGLTVPAAVHVAGAPRRIRVPGTAAAWQMRVTRPDGFSATAVDVWEASTTTQLWLLIHADRATTATVVDSLQG